LPGAEFLRSVLAISQSDVWAVGQLSHDTFGDYSFAVHFDGSGWKRVPTPNPLTKHNIDQNWLTSLAVLSSTDVWATLVARDTDYGILDHTFAVHWDGVQWQLVLTQNPGGKANYNDFWALAALASDDVWTVGSTGNVHFQPLSERWNGTVWRGVMSPSVEGVLLSLTRVPSRSALVATGNQIVQDSYTGTLVESACGIP